MEQEKLAAARARSKLTSRGLLFFAGLWLLAILLWDERTEWPTQLAAVSFLMFSVTLWYLVRIDKKVARLEQAARAEGEGGG